MQQFETFVPGPQTAEVKSVIEEKKPEIAVVKPEVVEAKPQIAEVKPQMTEVKPETTALTTETIESKPIVAEVKPVITEVMPAITEVMPEVTEVKPAITVEKPVIAEAKPIENRKTQPKKEGKTQLLTKPEHYTIQLIAIRDEAKMKQYMKKANLGGKAKYYKTHFEGKDGYILLYGNFKNRKEALLAMKSLPSEVQNEKPWIRQNSSVLEVLRDKP